MGHCSVVVGFGKVSKYTCFKHYYEEKTMSAMPDWVSSFPGAVTVSDGEHRIVYLNDAASSNWSSKGGASLIGTSLLACHNEHSKAIIEELLKTGGQNVYTIDKAGLKKVIFQSAWRDESGHVAGLIELSLILPKDMPHFVRG